MTTDAVLYDDDPEGGWAEPLDDFARYDQAVRKLKPEYLRLWDWLRTQPEFVEGRRTVRVLTNELANRLGLHYLTLRRAIQRLHDLGLLVWRRGAGSSLGTVLSAVGWVARVVGRRSSPWRQLEYRDLLARSDEHQCSRDGCEEEEPKPLPDPPEEEPECDEPPGSPDPISIPESTALEPEPPAGAPAEAEDAAALLAAAVEAARTHARETAPASVPACVRDRSIPSSIPTPKVKSSPLPSQGSGERFGVASFGMMLQKLRQGFAKSGPTAAALASQPPIPVPPSMPHKPPRGPSPPPPSPTPVPAAEAIRRRVEARSAALEAALDGAGVDRWIFRFVALDCDEQAQIPEAMRVKRLGWEQVEGWLAAVKHAKAPGPYFRSCLLNALKAQGRQWPWFTQFRETLARVAGIAWDKSWQFGRSRKKEVKHGCGRTG